MTRRAPIGGPFGPSPEGEHVLGPMQRAPPGMRRYPTREPVDVCVVGVASAGGVLVQRLARAGFSVVALEAGPFWDTERDWVSDEKGSHRLYWTEPRVTGGTHPLALGANDSGRAVGGGSVHWAGFTPRLHPSDFRVRTLDGVAVDWPMPYDELKPYYELLEKEIAGNRVLPGGSPGRGAGEPGRDAVARADHARKRSGADVRPAASRRQRHDGRRAAVHAGVARGGFRERRGRGPAPRRRRPDPDDGQRRARPWRVRGRARVIAGRTSAARLQPIHRTGDRGPFRPLVIVGRARGAERTPAPASHARRALRGRRHLARSRVTASRRGALLSVHDQGPGISPEELPLLFDRYFQTQRARAKRRGLGLGLFITKGLVEAHGGTIDVESTPGTGSVFRVWLPAGVAGR